MANRSRCTAFTPCSAISPPSPTMSSASGATASPPSSPPPPPHSTAPRPAWRNADRVDRPTPTTAYYLNGLRSKPGKVRTSADLLLAYPADMFGRSALRIADLVRNDVDVEQVTHHSSTGSGAESRIGGNSSSRDARVPSSASSD